MSPFPPQTEEQRAASARLQDLVAKAKAAYDALSPVDRAIHDARQRESFVRGNVGFDWPESERPRLDAAVKNNPQSILADEVERLRELARLLGQDTRKAEEQSDKLGDENRHLREALVANNDKLRSCYQVAARQGASTNWPSLTSQIEETLSAYHTITNEARAAFAGAVKNAPERNLGKSFYANSVDKCVVAETPEPGDLVEVTSFAWLGLKGRVTGVMPQGDRSSDRVRVFLPSGSDLNRSIVFLSDELKVLEKATPSEDPMFAEVVEIGDTVRTGERRFVVETIEDGIASCRVGPSWVWRYPVEHLTVVEKAKKETDRD